MIWRSAWHEFESLAATQTGNLLLLACAPAELTPTMTPIEKAVQSSPGWLKATLRRFMLEVFCCPGDKGELVGAPESRDDLVCTRCRRTYPLRDGVMRFVDGDEYAASFSYE